MADDPILARMLSRAGNANSESLPILLPTLPLCSSSYLTPLYCYYDLQMRQRILYRHCPSGRALLQAPFSPNHCAIQKVDRSQVASLPAPILKRLLLPETRASFISPYV